MCGAFAATAVEHFRYSQRSSLTYWQAHRFWPVLKKK
jgi:hypothetical protein